ncbi:septation protein SepH [Herbiconiux liukaitaii]|uniref:septation protein SepH n=1 Tax=Herbiconiux liukaitaii TaxID=3342799 RepID=UPI0035BA8FDB
MQDLTVVGVENGALIVSSDGGERYRIAIDEVLQSRIRQGIAAVEGGKKVSPREIQTHVRAGLSAFEVAELTGASVEYIERFEGPVLAERQFMVDSALRVPVQPTSPADPLGEEPLSTFGDALDERLEGLAAQDVRWASWKDESGWIVKLTFSSREIEHDARWQFDPKRHVLTPLNNEATTLSRHGELSEGLIPRLRAVSTTGEAGDTSDGRFDSGAFAPLERVAAPSTEEEPTSEASASPLHSAPAASPGARKDQGRPYDGFAIKRAPETGEATDHNQTADLLEALRRRRGERESAVFEPEAPEIEQAREHDERQSAAGVHPAFGGPRAVVDVPDTPLEGLEAELGFTSDEPTAAPAQKSASSRRQRASMPSWDEIVFGARSEDDPA